MSKILIVDDEKDIVELISYNLEKEGFSIAKAYDGEAALHIIKTQKPDLVVLDLMLPKMNGLDVCRNVRRNLETAGLPIIMLTAKSDEIDKVTGLEVGADDYVTKPFSVKELTARVRSILRRFQEIEKDTKTEEFVYKSLKINYNSCLVSIHGKQITLSPTELKLLFFLSRHPGRVYSRNQIIDHVWGDDTFITDRAVDVHIRRLRSQIEQDMENPHYIQTVRGFGYKFADIK
ncbi:MAG TPA: response regulator [Smithella sp.]|nr:response regulator [Smithella sp.]HNY50447.1 response regulator [Smithella sp.]HOG90102.1 response regulator [Smithella sp.]HOU50946.1 response regulator [Smithella sp.]HQG65129.1 response regulator [Smithella sp.]